MAVADHVSRNEAVEAIAEQINPRAEAGVQPAVLANDVQYRTSC